MIRFYIPHPKENEKIMLLLRRHPVILLSRTGFWVIVAIMPVLLYLVVGDVLMPFLENIKIFPIVILVMTIFYLYLWLFILHTFVDYYLDVWIVTNHRVLNIEHEGLFHRITSEQQLYRIQDITAETKGFFSTILDYGTVYIQTAGEQARFLFEQVRNPQACANKIIVLVEENKKLHKLTEAQEAADLNEINT